MTRKLKTLGVALIAVFALTAVMASAASAVNYTASKYPTTGTGTSLKGNDVFTTEGGTVKCASHFEGTLTEAKNSMTVKATYTDCEAFGFLSATVDMGSCDYLFTEPNASNNAVADVQCTDSTKPIRVVASTCEATIGAQTTTGHTNITNSAPNVSVRATVGGIKYTVTKDGFLCPFNGTGAKTGGTYNQESAITFASTNGATIDIG